MIDEEYRRSAIVSAGTLYEQRKNDNLLSQCLPIRVLGHGDLYSFHICLFFIPDHIGFSACIMVNQFGLLSSSFDPTMLQVQF